MNQSSAIIVYSNDPKGLSAKNMYRELRILIFAESNQRVRLFYLKQRRFQCGLTRVSYLVPF